MTLKNQKLISLISQFSEDTILVMLEQKIANDTYRKNYMKERNKLISQVKQTQEYKNLLKKLS